MVIFYHTWLNFKTEVLKKRQNNSKKVTHLAESVGNSVWETHLSFLKIPSQIGIKYRWRIYSPFNKNEP